MNWYLHGCPVCGGDLHDDPQDKGWVACFMCGRTFRVRDVQARTVGANREELPRAGSEPNLAPAGLPEAA
jgi:hypothetical protein